MKHATRAVRAAIAALRAAPAERQRRCAWLALAVAVHVLLCFVWRADVFHDATHVYLPYARRLLTEGIGFLGAEQSVWTPFVAYGFPALLGANATAVMAVDLVLSSAVVVMVYAIAASAHSARAGLCAAWIYAVSPAVAQIVLNVSTEIPYLFLCALWLWAFTRLEDSQRRRYAWIAGVALALATNTRGSILPFVYASAAIAWLASLRSGPHRRTWTHLALVQGIAAGLVTLVIAKNWILFGLPQIATGGGNALYLGTHTLTGGYEPFHGGLFFDVGSVTHGTHLSIEADRALGSAGRRMLEAQPLAQTAANYWRKLGAFLFYANVVLEDSLFTLRSWRIVLITLAAIALVRGWRHPVLLLAAAVTGYQVAVHLPVVYNPRYSEGSLELWLAVLGGCGAAVVSAWPRRRLALLVVVLALACYAGKTIRHLEGAVAPLRFSPMVPHRVAWEMSVPAPDVPGAARGAVLSAERSSLHIDVPDVEGFAGNATYGYRNFFLILDLATPEGAARCAKGRVSFVPATFAGSEVPESYYPFRLDTGVAKQTFAFGIARATHTWKAPLNGAGTLTLSFDCEAGAAVRVDRVAIAEATYGEAYGRDAASVPATAVPIVEYHHAGLGRYFITWIPEEIAALDAQAGPRGWVRTGETFRGFDLPTRERWPLCRFYIPPELGNAHFVGFGPAECEAAERLNPRYLREARDDPVYLGRPQDGRCPAGTRAVYRLRGGDAAQGQRFATSAAIRDAMLARGWIAEGPKANTATMCAAD